MAKLCSCPLLGAALLIPALTLACGACLEDKMAATYDYEVTQQAAAHKQTVVYCDVQGQVDAQALRQAATKVPGVDVASMRTSREPAAVAFALDTRLSNADEAAAKLTREMRGKATIVVLRSVGPPADTAMARQVPLAAAAQE